MGAIPPKLIVQLGKWVWTTMWHLMMSKLAPRSQSGAYIRPESEFRNSISDKADALYPPQRDRYRLYVGLSCPWAHRTLIVRTLKGLESAIAVTTVLPSPVEGGWVMDKESEGCSTLAQLYQLAQPGYKGRCTVPVLWDRQTKTIVNNESAEIIVMLNQLNQLADHPELDLYPASLRSQIDQWNQEIYPAINNGVYRCGFAQTQSAYDQACQELFACLDRIETVLADNRYLCGSQVTLADVRLFTTLFRFDAVYYGLFKCNRCRIKDYPNLFGYLCDLYQLRGVAQTCDLNAVKQDYYGNLFPLNPGGIIPVGFDQKQLLQPHSREQLGNTIKTN